MNTITQTLCDHYSHCFKTFGATAKGVDWGNVKDLETRYNKMLSVMNHGPERNNTLQVKILDVGCGYGGLFHYASSNRISINYTGIDVVPEMIDYASNNTPDAKFIAGDFFDLDSSEFYDYVVCNGILTQKLSASIKETDLFARELISKMFDHCTKGIAFNIMTTHVNFMVDNLYYRNPVELFAYCITTLTDKIIIDHAYGLYEYTIYLYKG